MTVLFVDQLTVIDFSYFHTQRGIVGESWIMDVELSGELDENGMVFDFAHVKKQIKQLVDSCVDHKFLFPEKYKFAKIHSTDSQLIIDTKTENGEHYIHTSPHQAVALIPDQEINPSNVKQYLISNIKAILPENVTQLDIHLREEDIQGAYYHYSHGLKKHFGDCQRIAHGHRSKIQVYIDEQRDHQLEKTIATDWKDIYLITKEDLSDISKENNIEYATLKYSANQGEFSLTLPLKRCDILETDTTVELIAEYLAAKIKKLKPKASIKLKAFEGVQKGAYSVLS